MSSRTATARLSPEIKVRVKRASPERYVRSEGRRTRRTPPRQRARVDPCVALAAAPDIGHTAEAGAIAIALVPYSTCSPGPGRCRPEKRSTRSATPLRRTLRWASPAPMRNSPSTRNSVSRSTTSAGRLTSSANRRSASPAAAEEPSSHDRVTALSSGDSSLEHDVSQLPERRKSLVEIGNRD